MQLSRRRSLASFVVALLLLYLLVQMALTPLRQFLANKYLQRGNALFVDQDYPEAVSQYDLALRYEPDLQLASTNRAMAAVADTDIAQAKPFFQAQGVADVLQPLADAEFAYSTPKAAVSEGVMFYAKAEYTYAQYPLLRAVNLDPTYAEAWNYLGLTYLELGKLNSTYLQKAKEAFMKRDALTPMYLH